MKSIILTALTVICSYTACLCGQQFSFAWLSDIHLNSFAYAKEDFKDAIEDINCNPEIDFVILSGDLTEFGDTREFMMLDTLLKELKRPYFMTTGNHDVNWSENGCTAFDRIFGPPHFCHDFGGYRIIGCGAGPSLRMGPPQIPREELVWLDSVITATPPRLPIIFINHFPIDDNLSNVSDLLRILEKRDVKCILSGHLHVNKNYDAYGIPGIIGRSTLRRADPAGGYNIVSLKNDTLVFKERIIKRETKPAWSAIAVGNAATHKVSYTGPDYSVNLRYPEIEESWSRKEISDIASQGDSKGNIYLYTNTAGILHAVNAKSGKELWSFQTGNKIFSAPFVTEGKVITTSCDGYVYALRLNNGKLIWKYDTGYPIVASPVAADGFVYIGSSNGKFLCLDLESGEQVWESAGLQGYIEARPAMDRSNIYIGTWGAKFYAIRRSDGKKVWEFDTGKGRYFSPGACWPEVIGSRVLVLSSDNFLRSFNPADGNIAWASDEAGGRESIGFSPDKKTVYIKGIGNKVTAADISEGKYKEIWSIEMPYKSDFVPTRIESSGKLIFIPTESGTVHAVKSDGSAIVWSRKVSHSAVTSLCKTGKKRIIAMTMDGTVTCLKYRKNN